MYGLTYAASAFIGLFLMPLYTRIFTVSEYGAIELITVVTQVIVLTAGLQVESGVARYYYECKNEEEKKRLISLGFFIKLIIPLLACLLIFFWLEQISFFLVGSFDYKKAFLISLLTVPLSSLFSYFLLLLRLQLAKKLYVIVATGNTVIMCLLCIYLVAYLQIGIEGVFWGYLLSYATFSTIGLLLFRKNLILTFSLPQAKDILAYSLPIIPVVLVSWFKQYIDRFLLLPFVGLLGVGYYTSGVRIGSIILMAISAFQLAWVPFSMSLIHKEGHKEIFIKIFTYFLFFLSLVALIITIFSQEIFRLLVPNNYWNAHFLVGPLCGSIVLNGTFMIIGIGLNIVKKTYLNTISFLAGTFCGIFSLLILTPRIGVMGAAVSALVASGVTFIFGYFLAQRNYYIAYEWKKALFIFILFLLIVPFNAYIEKNLTGAICITIKLAEIVVFLSCSLKILPREEILNALGLIQNKFKNFALSFNSKNSNL